MRMWIPALVIVAGIATLMAVGIVYGSIPELQVHQVLAGNEPGRKIKMHGKIARIDSETRPLSFTVRDKDDTRGSLAIAVRLDDVRPDLFQVGNDVAVEGYFDRTSGTLQGTRIYTKCPSKYEALAGPAPGAAPPTAPARDDSGGGE